MNNNVENNELEVSDRNELGRVNLLSENEVQSCNKMEPGGGSGTISPSDSMLRGEIYRPFTYVYLELNCNSNIGKITISVDPSCYTESSYVLEVLLNGRIIQSYTLTNSQLHQEKVILELNNVVGILASFQQKAEFIELKIRNQSSSDFGSSSIRVYNPPGPHIILVPDYKKRYALGKAVILFDYHIDLVTTPKTTVKINNKEVKFRQRNIFYRPYEKAETEMINLENVLEEKNTVEINLVSECYSIKSSFINVGCYRGKRYIGLGLRRMLDLSYDVLVDTEIDENQAIQYFINGMYVPENKTEKDPITGTFKWNIVSKIGGNMNFIFKIVNEPNQLFSQTYYYGFIDNLLSSATFKKQNNIGLLDFTVNMPVMDELGHELNVIINNKPYSVRKIDSFSFECDINLSDIQEYYNEVIIEVHDKNKEEVLYSGSLFFHDVK